MAFSQEHVRDGAAVGGADPDETVEVPLHHTIIRTGDLYSIYDQEVSRMLSVAAKNLKGGTGISTRLASSTASPSLAGNLRKTFEVSGLEGAGVAGARNDFLVGRLRGGWCEATPLRLANVIRRGRDLPAMRIRVGSVAIPIAHYRNSFRKELQPEKCHEKSLRGACQLLGEAVRLCHRWPFRLPAEEANNEIPEDGKIVDELLEWQEVFQGLSSVTRDWIKDEGFVIEE